MIYLLAAMIGLLGGVVSGLLGVGGGLVFVPLLVYVLRFDIHLAVGTSLAIVVPTALIAAARHGMLGNVSWKMALLLSIFTIAGSWFGASICEKIDPILLKRLFAVFLVVVAAKMFFQHGS